MASAESLQGGLTRRQMLQYGLYGALGGTLLAPRRSYGVVRQNQGRSSNVILISIDTLRADHLGCYGSHRNTSPNIDSFAERAHLFSQAYAPTPWTLPSHAGMLTGVHPLRMGMNALDSSIPEAAPVIAESLRDAGFSTAAFVDSLPKGYVGAERGFGRGFQTFSHVPGPRLKLDLPYVHDMSDSVDQALQWLNNRDVTKPFFLFLHTKSVHSMPNPRQKRDDLDGSPYDPPGTGRPHFVEEGREFRWRPGFGRHLNHYNRQFLSGELRPQDYPRDRLEGLEALYDSCIYYVDEHIGRLLDALSALGIWDDSVIIVTADHGEAFLEHRFFVHNEVYNQLLHVPLVVKFPDNSDRKIIDTPVALEDIAPTIFTLLGMDIPEMVTGVPLPMVSSVPKEDRSLFAYCEGLRDVKEEFSLQEGPWKIVYHMYTNERWQPELYDRSVDPEELSPLAGHDERKARMTARLLQWKDAGSPGISREIELDRKTIEHLRALGYLD